MLEARIVEVDGCDCGAGLENGVLVGESIGTLKENYLRTEKSYGNFVLELAATFCTEKSLLINA